MENLPQWNLSDLYKDITDKNIANDLSILEVDVGNLHSAYVNKIENLQPEELHSAVIKYEKISEKITRLYVFAYLNYVTDMSNQESAVFLQNIKDKVSHFSSILSFFEVEISKIDDEKYNNLLEKSEQLSKYKSYLDGIRRFKQHTLETKIESILTKKETCGIGAVIRIFDEHLSHLRFKFNEKNLTLTEILEFMSSKNEEDRKKAGLEIGRVFDENAWLYSIVLNTVAKNTGTNCEIRNYKQPFSARNLSNFIEDDVVENLRNSVVNTYKNTSHRYYKIKAKLLGKERLEFYDRNAPIPYDDDANYTFEQAKNLVIEAYRDFSPKIADIVAKFFENNWIDARVMKYKMSGAFCCSTISELHPYVMMSYQGKTRDIATLAHELGHGVHMYLSQSQKFLMQDTPLTLAETASLFGEQLVFEKIIKSVTDKQKRIPILCQKLDDTINTVVRQISFFDFEKKIHEKRKTGELSADEIGKIWLQTQSESLGNYVNLPAEYRNYWVYISHFIHSPFYVYSYAFGNLLVNSLYNSHKNIEKFEEEYITMLSQGGSLHHKELLDPFGIDISKQDFWNNCIANITEMIDELEDCLK